jgi:hypothetical protein
MRAMHIVAEGDEGAPYVQIRDLGEIKEGK